MINFKRICALLVCGIAFNATVFSQQLPTPDIVPPSPEAAALAKIAQIPVSYNTGSPQIDIPLYDIKVNDMEIPIALSYQASGIRVAEVASWVGLGWTLRCGGAITRSMRGKPDESSYGYFNEAQWNTWQSIKDLVLPAPGPNGGAAAQERHAFQKKVSTGEYDLSPDIFYFNFANYSGRIVFDVQKKPVIIPYQDLKISHPFSGSDQWVITTPEGIEYIFKNSDAERTVPLNEGAVNQGPFLSTWYLSEVRSKKQPGFIVFQYTTMTLGGIQSMPSVSTILPKLSEMPGSTPCEDAEGATETSSNTFMIDTKYLTGITFTNGSIQFNATNDRLDTYPNNPEYTGLKLNSLTVLGPGPSLVKQVDFKYMSDYPAGRLALESVTETGKGPYRFTYYDGLPATDSFAQDHWGYYNGATNNKSLLPGLTLSEQSFYRPSPLYLAVGGANREPTDAAVAGTIASITYPTGGKRTFTFEQNQISAEAEVPVRPEAAAFGGRLNPSMNAFEQSLYNDYKTDWDYEGTEIDVRSTTFTIDYAQNVELFYSMQSSQPGSIAEIAQFLFFEEPFNFRNPKYSNRNGIVWLNPGTYMIVVAASQDGVRVGASVSYMRKQFSAIPLGGMRIAAINDYDRDKLVQSQTFRYTMPKLDEDGGITPPPGSGSGGPTPIPDPGEELPPPTPPTPEILPSTAEYFYPSNYKKKTACGRLFVSSTNLNNNTTFEGYHMGYKRVEVLQKNFQVNADGYVPGDYSSGSTVYIYENNINDIMRGLLRQVVYFNAAYDTVRYTKYRYNYNDGISNFSSYAPAVEMERKQYVVDQGCVINGQPCTIRDYYLFNVKEKRYVTFFPYQTEIIEKVFSKTDYPHGLVTKTQVTQCQEVPDSYENSHTLPVETIKTTSTGEKIIERFINSPGQGNAGTPDIKVPLRHDIIKESGGQQWLIGSTRTQYQDNLPVSVQLHEGAMPVGSEDAHYGKKLTNVYNNGKLIQRSLSDGFPTAYLWDSNNIYPLAEIKNCTPGQAAYTSFEGASNEGGWTFTLSAQPGYKTGTKCHGFVSTTATITKTGLLGTVSYKVTYWAKNGTPTVSNVTASNDAAAAGADGWRYFEKTVSSTSTLTISAAANTLIDELRFYPITAQMTSFTYQAGAGATSRNDPNNKLTFYEYDAAGRLVNAYDHEHKRVQNFDYHYRTATN